MDYVWENDQTILFSARRRPGQKESSPYGEQTDLYRIDIRGGEARHLISLPLAIEQMEKLNDRELLVTAEVRKDCPDFALLTEKERQDVMDRRKAEEDYQVVTESPFVLDGSGFIEHAQPPVPHRSGQWENRSSERTARICQPVHRCGRPGFNECEKV